MKFYVLRLPNEAFNMSDSETLKFKLGISNDLFYAFSLFYVPLVSGDNNFICRSSDAMTIK
jgi:hypothetical protein